MAKVRLSYVSNCTGMQQMHWRAEKSGLEGYNLAPWVNDI